jgi:hypothetical protein
VAIRQTPQGYYYIDFSNNNPASGTFLVAYIIVRPLSAVPDSKIIVECETNPPLRFEQLVDEDPEIFVHKFAFV